MMKAYEVIELIATQAASGRPYLEFTREPAFSLGLYVLPAGGEDTQTPHTEDEAYYVVRGRGVIRVAGEDREVGPGSIIVVDTGVEHYFHNISEELAILVFFAPPEGTNR
ncbi:MAG: cupin domain-containing protein [Anaerolineae bacterium]